MTRGTMRKSVAVGLLVCLLSSWPVVAADAAAPFPVVASSPLAPHIKPVQAITEGQPSPVTGVVMPTETFMLYLNTQVALEEANKRIAWRDDTMKKLAADAERTWWEKNAVWVGVGAGFIASVFVVWQIKQLIIPKA